MTEAIHFVYASYGRLTKERHTGYDRDVRNPHWTRRILDQLGNPDHEGFNIAVTGSKGKGSHSILVAGILQRLGFRVGLFTSPHLVDFLERIRVQGEIISEEAFLRWVRVVQEVVRQFDVPDDEYIGPVGLVAAVAALFFRDCHTDFNVYELGRGALHDDVNQVVHQGAVIAPIFPEHLDRLGPTWEDVVREKMGILTEDTRFAVSYRQEAFVQKWMDMYASAAPAHRIYLDQDIHVDLRAGDEDTAIVEATYGDWTHRARIGTALRPFYENVGVALVAAAMAIRNRSAGQAPYSTDWRNGRAIEVDLTDMVQPGRLQVIQHSPTIVIDGSIHEVNARFVRRWVEEHQANGPMGRVVAIFSLPDDKDAPGVLRTLSPVVDEIVFTTSSNRHLSYTRDLLTHVGSFAGRVDVIPSVETALSSAVDRAQPPDLVLCIGTQSFVGDALRFFRVPTSSIWRSERGSKEQLHASPEE